MKLNTVLDAPIIETGGFHVMKDPELRGMIGNFADTVGVVILTDSDHAGHKLRSYLHEICSTGRVYDAYIPEVPGKEARKSRPGAEGILGVEGIDPDIILESVLDAVSPCSGTDDPVTASEWFSAGLSGCVNSAQRRADFLRKHGLPSSLSNKQALRYLNAVPGPEILRRELELLGKT
jgi:ribonuclease M5